MNVWPEVVNEATRIPGLTFLLPTRTPSSPNHRDVRRGLDQAVRCRSKGPLLWTSSTLEAAAGADRVLAGQCAACRRHRHFAEPLGAGVGDALSGLVLLPQRSGPG